MAGLAPYQKAKKQRYNNEWGISPIIELYKDIYQHETKIAEFNDDNYAEIEARYVNDAAGITFRGSFDNSNQPSNYLKIKQIEWYIYSTAFTTRTHVYGYVQETGKNFSIEFKKSSFSATHSFVASEIYKTYLGIQIQIQNQDGSVLKNTADIITTDGADKGNLKQTEFPKLWPTFKNIEFQIKII